MKTRLINKEIKNNYVIELLKEKGLNEKEIDYLINVPDDRYLEPPAALDNIEAGFQMFEDMIKLGEEDSIVVVKDSDVDGFTSAAIFIKYFRNFNKTTKIIPILHKGKGHGLSDTIQDIEELYDSGENIKYVVLPDSSSNDYIFHEQLKEKNIYCLILDHHIIELDTKFSDHTVIINNQLSSNYQNKDLCGAGVTWQFCRYCDERFNTSYANEYMDLAALGLVSDMMSMISLENRYIVSKGLKNIKNDFFKALCEKQSFSMGGKVTPTTIAFYITPLINAMIRVGTMEEKTRCSEAFIDGKELVVSHKRGANGALEEIAIESARECVNARAKQNRILDKAEQELEIKIHKYDLLENKILFIELDEEDFPPELNGLIAMRAAARYQRPAIVARLNNEGEIKGSSRGLNQSELTSFKDFMDKSGLFTFTAGHDNACGIGILERNLKSFHEYANKELAETDFGETWYDVNFERIAMDNDIVDIIYDVAKYEDLYGQGFLEPLIHVKDINITKKDIQLMGKNQDTIKIVKNGVTYIKFHAKDMIEELGQFDGDIKLEVVGRANLNEWMNTITPQLFISSYQIEDGELGF